MNELKSVSAYAHIYLGYPYEPTPVFRDLEPAAHEWPEGAIFAVTVRRAELVYPEHWPFPGQVSATEFVAEDGWPVGFPEDKKHGYFKSSLDELSGGDFYRGLFHRGTPLPWKNWSCEDWEAFRNNYQSRGCNIYTETKAKRCARDGAQLGIVRALRPLLPAPTPDNSN